MVVLAACAGGRTTPSTRCSRRTASSATSGGASRQMPAVSPKGLTVGTASSSSWRRCVLFATSASSSTRSSLALKRAVSRCIRLPWARQRYSSRCFFSSCFGNLRPLAHEAIAFQPCPGGIGGNHFLTPEQNVFNIKRPLVTQDTMSFLWRSICCSPVRIWPKEVKGASPR